MDGSLLAERLKDVPTLRLKSRKPPCRKTAEDLICSGFETGKRWRDECIGSTVT